MADKRELRKWSVGREEEILPGDRKIIDVDGNSIGIFNVNGHFTAVLNVCPHELAPICRGPVRGTTLPSLPGQYRWGHEGEILACPWHGWEFNLLSGESVVDRRKLRLFPVEVIDGIVYLLLRPSVRRRER